MIFLAANLHSDLWFRSLRFDPINQMTSASEMCEMIVRKCVHLYNSTG